MKKFSQFLKEAKIYSLNPDNTKMINNISEVKFIHSSLQKARGYSYLVSLSDEFHSKYKQSENYVSMSGKKDHISNKKIRDLMKNNSEMEYPEAEISDDGSVCIKNGAHRYGMMSRLKMEKKVCLKDSCLKNAKKFGYIK